MFDVKYGEADTYTRAYTVTARGHVYVFVGAVTTLTAKRRRAMATVVCDAMGLVVDDGYTDLVSHRAIRRDALVVRPVTTTNLDDSTDVRRGVDYTDKLGGGLWEAATVSFHAVA